MRDGHECCPCGAVSHKGGWVCLGCGLPPWHCAKDLQDPCLGCGHPHKEEDMEPSVPGKHRKANA